MWKHYPFPYGIFLGDYKLILSIYCYSFSFQTACCWNCVACREDSIVAQEDTCLKCAHGE